MSLRDQLQNAQKDAMRAKEKIRLGTIRMALAEIKQIEIDTRTELCDADILAVLVKMVKKRRDAAEQFAAAGREDLQQTEEAEILVLEAFMPQALTEAEVNDLIDAAIAETGAAGMQDMGKVMNLLRPKVAGRADMGKLSAQIKARLNG